MGIIDFVSGKKITVSQARGKPPLFQGYNYQKHAKNTRIKDSIGFNKKVSDVRWNKLMQKTGQANFKTKGGEVIDRGEAKKMVASMIKKSDFKGLSGQQIKKKLVREHGMRYSDAGTIARAATYHYYDPPAEGPTWKEIKAQEKQDRKRKERNVLMSVMSREDEEGVVDRFRDRRNAKNAIKRDIEGETSERINAKNMEYGIAALSNEAVSTGDFRGRKTPRASAADMVGAAAVAGGIGAKEMNKSGKVVPADFSKKAASKSFNRELLK
ncbi:hypothetical protein DRH27_01430 [Candidatus Falkowbacteria bacterium]|nr:MAG: hypothetical protein DRH27_01430 [Candidatus Falkowbacteria bacterium]